MREIEIKARVHDMERLLQRLKEQAVMIGRPITQRDQVYGLSRVIEGRRNQQLVEGDATSPWLRVRTETTEDSTVIYLTLKRSRETHLDKIEHEVVVSNADEAVKLVGELGFTEYSDVTKTRRKGMLGDIEICVDEVKDLGTFVELEKLTHDETPYEEVADELWTVLNQLGVERSDEVTRGYDVLLFEGQG